MWRAIPATANSSTPSETRRTMINQRMTANYVRIPDGVNASSQKSGGAGATMAVALGVKQVGVHPFQVVGTAAFHAQDEKLRRLIAVQGTEPGFQGAHLLRAGLEQ